MRSVDKKTAIRAGLSAVVGVLIYVGLVLFYIPGANSIFSSQQPLDYFMGFETDDLNDLGSSPVGSSGDAGAEVVSNPTHSGDHALALHVNDAVPGAGVGARIDNEVFESQGYFGGENLPDAAYYSAWFYIPEFVSLDGGDDWNIFQFRQTYPVDNGYTRHLIDAIKLWDLGGGYGFTLESQIDAQGNWDIDESRKWESDRVKVSPEEWFQVKVFRAFGDVADGHYTVWVNDVEIFDLELPTEMYGDPWDDFGLWRRRWSVNSYVTGNNHQPDSHTLVIDDLEIRTD